MEWIDRAKVKQEFVFWVSNSLKCLSFHQEPRFECFTFESHSEMWQMVHDFIERGYNAQ